MKKIFVINGPSLNLLGQRETSIYGKDTLKNIENRLSGVARTHNIELDFFQSNHEGEIIDFLHQILFSLNEKSFSPSELGIIINAAAFTHTSVAIRDALTALPSIPIIELHISNIFKREHFRHHSYLSDIATGLVVGLGTRGYDLALNYFLPSHKVGDLP